MKIRDGKEKRFRCWYLKHGGGSLSNPFSFAVEWADRLETLMVAEDMSAKEVFSKYADIVWRNIVNKYHVQINCDYAINVLSQYWAYGEDLRRWYNS